ncbi:TatD family hydrolase [Azospirillum sp. YIM B02556]|uniref:TatD family hydrolase n=1 Tax=Azospirillum endophyticum TaxID=2800326 RepID=A0ABS1F8A4_9PROT|nr:TatD family hydrolase [Azospirillum endophyticum]MBK1839598.1 TatD family hydrolase [Azospirillum endophyticum]
MKLFDPHIHMTSRTTDDYAAMRRAGIVAVTEPAFWLGQPRTHAGSFEDYFLSLVGWERFRASQFGIRHYCTLGLNPKEANNPDLVDPVLDLVDLYLEKDGVVAVGEIGYDDMTPAEDDILSRQVEMAMRHGLPIMVHTPHRDKKAGTRRTIDLLREAGVPPHRVLIDHNNEETLPITLDSGCWAGHTIYPGSKMDEPRMVGLVQAYGAERIMVNSSADWGISDPLKVPKTVAAMEEAGIPAATIETIVWRNPIAFYAQSGRLDPDELERTLPVDQRLLFEGNTVLRGQKPMVEAALSESAIREPAMPGSA